MASDKYFMIRPTDNLYSIQEKIVKNKNISGIT